MKEGLSLRDRALIMILGVVVLYVFSGIFWMVSVSGKWTVSLKKYKTAVKKYERENSLIKQADRWNMEYLSEKEKMPMFPEGMDVDTHWMDMMDAFAATNYISISRSKPGKEVSKGDVYELPLEIGNWEGSLEGLVKFLWDVQSSGQSMMDVSAMRISPNQQKKGFLKGSFTLTCAYMRGEVAQGEDDDDDDDMDGSEPDAPSAMMGDDDGDDEPDGAGTPSEDAVDGDGKSAKPDADGSTGISTDKAAEMAAEE